MAITQIMLQCLEMVSHLSSASDGITSSVKLE